VNIGIGAYAGARPQSILAAGAEVVLTHQCPAVAVAVRQANPWALIVGRFDDGDDAAQVDQARPPEAEADRWTGIIERALSAVPRGTYSAACGICEAWPSPGDTKALRWRAAFEAALCDRVQGGLRTPYAALSCPVANLEPSELPLFEEVFERANMVNYHGYLAEWHTRLVDEVGPWHLWRPLDLWLPELRRLGLRVPSFLLGEVGTFACWRGVLTPDDYSRLCIDIALAFGERCRALGVPYAGGCGFGFGTVGTMAGWRQDGTEAIYAAATAAEVPPPEEDPVSPAEFDRWTADVWHRAGVPLPDTGIAKFWKTSARAGHYLGRPEGPEHRTEDGRWAYQEFSGAVLHCKVGEWIVSKGLPPFA
jgi:hypothetical protein